MNIKRKYTHSISELKEWKFVQTHAGNEREMKNKKLLERYEKWQDGFIQQQQRKQQPKKLSPLNRFIENFGIVVWHTVNESDDDDDGDVERQIILSSYKRVKCVNELRVFDDTNGSISYTLSLPYFFFVCSLTFSWNLEWSWQFHTNFISNSGTCVWVLCCHQNI